MYCVLATSKYDKRSGFSNYGTDFVHVFGPGSGIDSCGHKSINSYVRKSGTSMACPAVAGLAALVASMNSTRSGMEIKQLIMDNVQVKAKYAEFVSTSGLIDVEKTIKAAAGAAPTPPSPPPPAGCVVPHWKGDNLCDDENNNEGCDWDGGDCCGPDVKTTYCSKCECLDPAWGPCHSDPWKGDNWCDDENNHPGCEYDGGDCCGDNVKTFYCTACECLDPEFLPPKK